mmetsp:Transcript_43829/g.115879  ORF Transcript_43829/g.115879 Transcript_43829/m.115879 type:complete len:218 (-) Transcript_43829:1469-2122(-)
MKTTLFKTLHRAEALAAIHHVLELLEIHDPAFGHADVLQHFLDVVKSISLQHFHQLRRANVPGVARVERAERSEKGLFSLQRGLIYCCCNELLVVDGPLPSAVHVLQHLQQLRRNLVALLANRGQHAADGEDTLPGGVQLQEEVPELLSDLIRCAVGHDHQGGLLELVRRVVLTHVLHHVRRDGAGREVLRLVFRKPGMVQSLLSIWSVLRIHGQAY